MVYVLLIVLYHELLRDSHPYINSTTNDKVFLLVCELQTLNT